MGGPNCDGCRSWVEDIYWNHFQFLHFAQFLRTGYDQNLVSLFFHLNRYLFVNQKAETLIYTNMRFFYATFFCSLLYFTLICFIYILTYPPSPHESRSNPYFSFSSSSSSFSQSPPPFMETVVTIRNVLGRWSRKVGEATRKAENLAENTWQHLKTSPSFTEAAMGRIAQGTKVLAEGGYEKIFVNTFDTDPEEQLQNSYACYLSTSTGPVVGVLYISTTKIAYSSDNPISYKTDNQTEWSYYKVVIPLYELKAVNPSSNTMNPAEKYIQVISSNNHEFWFMGFLNYEGAVNCLQEALQASKLIQSEA